MTVNVTDITSGPYAGNDVADTFSYDFTVKIKTQLSVFQTSPSGIVTTMILDSDYTVTGVGVEGGGTVVRTAGPLPTGYQWFIISNYQLSQLTDFESQGGFFPDVHEAAFDKLTYLLMQIQYALNKALSRVLRLSDSYTGDASTVVPNPVANHILVWNSTATAIESVPLPTGGDGGDGGDAADAPYLIDTTYEFVNSLPYPDGTFSVGDYIKTQGRTLISDNLGALYQVTDVAPTGWGRNYENYIPLDGDGSSVGVTLWAVLKEGVQRDFKQQAIEIIAHRSMHFAGVQNTSFNDGLAMTYGVHALETDVQVTSDGVLVRYHDNTLDGETNGSGAVSANTYATVRGLTLDDVAGTIYADRIKIGRFDEFVAFAKSVGARIYPEIKQYRTIADIELMVNVIEAYEYESMTIFQSFLIDDLVEVRRLNKRVGVGWLTTNINTTQENADFDTLQKLKFCDVLIQEGIIRSFPDLVDKIYSAGVGCAAWGLENNTEMNEVLQVGVFRQMIDQPQLAASVRGLVNVNY